MEGHDAITAAWVGAMGVIGAALVSGLFLWFVSRSGGRNTDRIITRVDRIGEKVDRLDQRLDDHVADGHGGASGRRVRSVTPVAGS